MKLYELAQNYAELLEIAEEIESDALVDTLEALQDAIEDKAENIAKIIKNLEADAKIIKEEEKRLAERRQSIEKKIDRLKQYLQEQLEVAGLQKVKRATITVAIQNNPPSVKVVDEKLIPSEYMIQQAPQVNKKVILSLLKEGQQIPGCELIQTKGVRIK